MISLLVTLLTIVLVMGLVWYLVDLLPIDARFKQIIQILLVIIAILYLLSVVPNMVSGSSLRIR